MSKVIMAVDQGTTSSRAILFDHSGKPVASYQMEHEQIFPKPGWVEHDPAEIWRNTAVVMGRVLVSADMTHNDVGAVGITQQRETTIVWDKRTGRAVYNAIVWQDTRTKEIAEDVEEVLTTSQAAEGFQVANAESTKEWDYTKEWG